MDMEAEVRRYTEEPNLLLDLCREVLARLDTGAGGEAAKQLQAVSVAIEQLQKQGIPVPDGLRAEKLRLAGVQASSEKGADKLRKFVDGLDLLVRPFLLRNRPATERKPRLSSGRTPRETLRRLILEALEANGGRATVAEVYQAIEERMQGQFLPDDWESVILGGGGPTVPSWQKRVHTERHHMVQEGLLRNDSSRGVWELNKQ